MSDLDDLYNVDWEPFPNVSYIMKSVFSDTGYHVLVSNFTSLYAEKMTEEDIEKRFNRLNSHVQMKPKVILCNLKESLKNCLTNKSDNFLEFEEKRIIIMLKFHAAPVSCRYNIELSLQSTDMIMKYIIGPTVLGSLLSQRKVLELQRRLSVENAKCSTVTKTISSQDPIDPDWLRGENVPGEIICSSFLTVQSHFKDLYVENSEAFSSRKVKVESTSAVNSVSPHKKDRFLERTDKDSSIDFHDDLDDAGSTQVKKEENTNSNKSSREQPRLIAKKKKLFRF